ncbi:hypothetical protein [uncultured Thiohalocapsa sp.]|uniref:hypothetical protein n=1 Tax=uncultured Thiohalocapsa sp. TaxID=768990 RepID=UPI0025CE4765|nr:hypothetical protein [uncultured Thiohalocapsa sp.]
MKDHLTCFFEARFARAGETQPYERLILSSLSGDDHARMCDLLANIEKLFTGAQPEHAASLKEHTAEGLTLKSANAVVRKILGGAMFLLLICSSVLLLAGFYDYWTSDPSLLALSQLGGYAICLALIYYLEGGQAARFMAKGDPPEMHGDRFRPFLVKDLLHERSIQGYVGARQFFTLGVTTIAYALFVKNWSLPQFFALSPGAGDALLLLSHILVTTTLFQILPQLKANRDRAFACAPGSLLTYHVCEKVAKVFDPSLPAHYVDRLTQKMRQRTNEQTVARSEATEIPPVFLTNNVSKFKSDGGWRSPSEVKAILSSNGMRADVGWLAVPTADEHLPPHYALAVLVVINKTLATASASLRQTVLDAFFSVVEGRTR